MYLVVAYTITGASAQLFGRTTELVNTDRKVKTGTSLQSPCGSFIRNTHTVTVTQYLLMNVTIRAHGVKLKSFLSDSLIF